MKANGIVALVAAALLCACGPSEPAPATGQANHQPPPLPADAETVTFERSPSEGESAPPSEERESRYWGVAPGEPVPIMWEDLMPEGAYEDVVRQQEAYLAALERRYRANATSLADAQTFEEIEEGSELDYMPQFGSFDVVEDLDGERIRIPGYVVPFDFDPKQRHAEFLFVPYMGACIHTPPPPPNQIIFVRADPAIPVVDIWAPYWLEGTLTAEQALSDLGDAAYALSLESLSPYPVLGAAP